MSTNGDSSKSCETGDEQPASERLLPRGANRSDERGRMDREPPERAHPPNGDGAGFPDPDVLPFAPSISAEEPIADAGFETICEHFAEDRTALGGSAATPIFQASTFVYPDAEAFERRKEPGGKFYEYTRVGNPTTSVLTAKLARLESAAWCYCVASGMAAISAAINACVHNGAHVVAAERCYWPTARYLRNYLPRFGVETTFVSESDPAAYIAAIQPNTRLIYLEAPTSGTFDVIDIRPVAAAARERGIATIFDNSWASPYFFNPLEYGIDLVVHSATKYIGGHSDVVAGVVCGRGERLKRLVFREVELVGGTIDPFAAWLLLRGSRTLALRMERHQQSALAVAQALSENPRVRRVRHPGLASHPHHGIFASAFRGSGSLFAFELHEQSREATHRFIDRLKLFSIGVSWGGHESLVLGGEFFSDPRAPAWSIRLHCGLETTADLVRDVLDALG